MKNVNKIEAVSERDIDLIVLEEMNVSKEFCEWLARKTAIPVDTIESFGGWHSITDARYGESDLVMILESESQIYALLVENKIDAIAMPEQGLRYKKRGEIGIQEGKWNWFTTCMVAPRMYLERSHDSDVYTANVSYESMARWFEIQCEGTARGRWKNYLIREAIEQNRRGYQVKPDEKVTDFWIRYWEENRQRFPELEMKSPAAKPSNSDWVYFSPTQMPKGYTIVHKLERGYVDLQIAHAAERVPEIREAIIDEDCGVVKAGKSAAVRKVVSRVDKFEPFSNQMDKAIEGMQVAVELLTLATKLKQTL